MQNAEPSFLHATFKPQIPTSPPLAPTCEGEAGLGVAVEAVLCLQVLAQLLAVHEHPRVLLPTHPHPRVSAPASRHRGCQVSRHGSRHCPHDDDDMNNDDDDDDDDDEDDGENDDDEDKEEGGWRAP